MLTHGFHPWAEDGGLYVAGVEYKLNPQLFPAERAFVTEPLHYSLFAPIIADLVRISHLSLPSVLLLLYLLSAFVMLWAGLRIARRCFVDRRAQSISVALVSAWWTLPIAGTSLLLMDPYVTARSIAVPLSVAAIAEMIQTEKTEFSGERPPRRTRSWRLIRCGVLLLTAALFHPLMAGYGCAFLLLIRLCRHPLSSKGWLVVAVPAILLAAIVQFFSRADSIAANAAARSRYYWFLSQWHWFEWLGLFAPMLIFAALLQWRAVHLSAACKCVCRAGIAAGLISLVVALLFAQEHFASHAVARLQPLRMFLFVYVFFALTLGGLAPDFFAFCFSALRSKARHFASGAACIALVTCAALVMFEVQSATFPSSPHIALPGRTNWNPWVQAFLWARDNTSEDDIFALDAHYVNTAGEDAQSFRALSQRSAIPDYSKDGGEASIAPALAAEWLRASEASRDLDTLSDAERERRLRPFDVTWIVLSSKVPTQDWCPFRNADVKVCRLRNRP